MGRGILEYERYRTERVGLATPTSDPASPATGEAWLRLDLADAPNDKYGEFRFYDGSSVRSVDVIAPGTGETPVEEPLRVQTPNGVGVVKAAARADATYPEYSLQHNGSPLGLGYSAIPDSEVNHWPLDEGSGSTAFDTTGNENGSINGASWVTDSKTGGYALSFQNGDEVVLFDFDTGQSFTFTAWIKVRDFSTGSFNAGAVFYDQRNGLRVDGGGEIGFSYRDANQNNHNIGATGYSTNTWYFIAGGIDAETDEISVWVGDTQQNSKTVSGEADSSSNNFLLGYNPNADLLFDGIIDDPRIFLEAPNQDLVSSVRSATE